ncbi:ribose-phosphate pyrophosphokinase, partial [Bifidobacterium pseudocatenulatum]|nr:ribose-phosphate pyrophosphokinase [Bifidobacterium pseudocatenulatum]
RLIAIDFHAPQLQGFFDIPVDHLQAAPILASYFAQSDLDLENTVIVAPDHAGVTLARRFAEFLGTPIAIIDNRNLEQQRGTKTTETPTSIIGDVAN